MNLEKIEIPLDDAIGVRVQFKGGNPTRESIERLIAILDLLKSSYPEPVRYTFAQPFIWTSPPQWVINPADYTTTGTIQFPPNLMTDGGSGTSIPITFMEGLGTTSGG